MDLRIGIYGPARQLLQRPSLVHITELVGSAFSWLNLHFIEIHRAFVNAYRRSCFHTGRGDSMTRDAFCEMWHSWLCDSSPRYHLSPDMHQTIEEGACRHDNTFGIEFCAPDGTNADCFAIFYE